MTPIIMLLIATVVLVALFGAAILLFMCFIQMKAEDTYFEEIK